MSKYPTILVRTSQKELKEKVIPLTPFNTCLNALFKHTYTASIVIDDRKELTPDSPGGFVVFSGRTSQEILDQPTGKMIWLQHRIFINREAIFDEYDYPYQNEYCFIYGDLIFSKNGSKITATSPSNDRISTDAEVLEYIAQKYGGYSRTIFWYYDPLP